MSPRKKRVYDASGRRESAEQTRRAILAAAKQIFLERGYAATTMPAIAEAADVALDTVYASVGKKPALFRLLVETAISGADEPIPAAERGYVQAMIAEPDAATKLRIYANAIREMHPRLAPLVRVLQIAAEQDGELAQLWREIADRRANNMRLVARELHATGALRPELSLDEVADIIWSMNAPEFYLLLVAQRGWSPDQFADWLADAWCRLLLRSPRPG